MLLLLPLLGERYPYLVVLMIDILVAVLFATSLHFIMGPGGMHSFGHAAYFGLGAYGAALLFKALGLPMIVALLAAPLVAAIGALLFGWFAVRLSGVYLAMLTLAFSQIVWSVVFQWDEFTGGSNGLVGIWPAAWLSRQARLLLPDARGRAWRACGCCGGCCSRRSATRCAPGAILRCAPTRSASTWCACTGRRSCSAGLVCGRRRRAVRLLQGQHLAGGAWPSAARSTAW